MSSHVVYCLKNYRMFYFTCQFVGGELILLRSLICCASITRHLGMSYRWVIMTVAAMSLCYYGHAFKWVWLSAGNVKRTYLVVTSSCCKTPKMWCLTFAIHWFIRAHFQKRSNTTKGSDFCKNQIWCAFVWYTYYSRRYEHSSNTTTKIQQFSVAGSDYTDLTIPEILAICFSD